MPLTDVRIRSLKPADKPHKYSDGGGLFLFIPPSGSKLWRMAYRFEGKSRLLSFGAYPAVSLKDARERRDEARRLLAKGIDPSAYKRQQQEARRIAERDSFQNIAREWHATRMAAFSAKHQGTVMYRLCNYIFPFIGNFRRSTSRSSTVETAVRFQPRDSIRWICKWHPGGTS